MKITCKGIFRKRYYILVKGTTLEVEDFILLLRNRLKQNKIETQKVKDELKNTNVRLNAVYAFLRKATITIDDIREEGKCVGYLRDKAEDLLKDIKRLLPNA